jgi:hypothetical protein
MVNGGKTPERERDNDPGEVFRGEKEHGITWTMLACLGKTEEDRSGRISPETGEEEADVVAAVVVPGSIP